MAGRQLDDANAFLLGSESVPSASFLSKGAKHEGEILDLAMRQQLDIDTRKPLFWENGDPKKQLVITIQTDEYDDQIEDDDGRRRLYVKYKMKDAIADAVREAGADSGVQVGGWISVQWVKSEKPQNRAKSGAKIYAAVYEPPDPSAAANAYLDADDPDAEPDPEPDPPKAKRGSRAAKAEPDAEPDPPKRGRAGTGAGRSRRSAGAAARSSRSEFVDDGGDAPY